MLIGFCINRNIVECKLISVCEILFFKFSINRNIVECKYFYKDYQMDELSVLIETLWNVNEIVIFNPCLKYLY